MTITTPVCAFVVWMWSLIHIARGWTIFVLPLISTLLFWRRLCFFFFGDKSGSTPSHITDQILSRSCFPCARYKFMTGLVKGRGTTYILWWEKAGSTSLPQSREQIRGPQKIRVGEENYANKPHPIHCISAFLHRINWLKTNFWMHK